MNWLTNYVRPKIRAVLKQKKETPDNLWHKCKNCGQLLYIKDLEANLHVCPHCDYHERIGPRQRFDNLFNGGEYTLIDLP